MKNYRISYFILSLSLLITLGCGKSENQAISISATTPDEKEINQGVILTQDTALRIDPLIFSSRITQLNKGQVVKILDKSAEEKTLAGHNDYWYKIKLENRITGWVFGKHIKILDASGQDAINSYLGKFWEKETEEISKELHGKWWSINKYGDFTNHALEISKNGNYRSYYKGSSKPIEGVYNFDFNQNMVIFLSGTTFKNDLHYSKKGNTYSLGFESGKDTILFKKISINPSSDIEEEPINKSEDSPIGNNEDES